MCGIDLSCACFLPPTAPLSLTPSFSLPALYCPFWLVCGLKLASRGRPCAQRRRHNERDFRLDQVITTGSEPVLFLVTHDCLYLAARLLKGRMRVATRERKWPEVTGEYTERRNVRVVICAGKNLFSSCISRGRGAEKEPSIF